MSDSKIVVYINLMALLGSHLIESTTKTGRPAFVLDVHRSRARIKRDRKGHRDPEVWVRVQAIPSAKMSAENTHFVTEVLTNEELKQGLRSKFVGAARIYQMTKTKH